MRRLPPSIRALLWALCLAAAVPAAAASGTTWLCGIASNGVQLVCLAEDGPMPAAADLLPTSGTSGTPGTPGATTTVRGTGFPLDPRRRWFVDFWSPGADLEQLELLARATICYRSPGCEVVFAWPVVSAAVARR
jgi:hypothetical protein